LSECCCQFNSVVDDFVQVRKDIDFEAPMLYSTLFPYGLGVLASYSSNHIDSVAIGITGQWPNFQNQSYSTWEDFQMDLLYAHNVIKAPYIGIYSWEAYDRYSLFSSFSNDETIVNVLFPL
jgi:hypothetical protein